MNNDDSLDFSKLPKVVKDAAERLLPKATWHSAEKIKEDDRIAYEIDGSDGKDRDVTLMVTSEGKVVEFDTEQKNPTNVPDKVMAAVKAKWPKFTVTETHHIRVDKNLQSASDGEHLYDLRGHTAGGREIDIQVGADGEILEWTAEVALDKVPNVVKDALKKSRPKFDIGTAYALHEKEKVNGYHFEGKGADGRDKTISVTPDGKQVEVVE